VVFKRQKRLNFYLIVFICSILLFAAIADALAADSKSTARVPIGADGAQGSKTGMPDPFTGAMSYSIPLDVPPGRKGMEPALALNYHNTNGDSWVGTGWELELGAIRRDFKFGPNFNGNSYQIVKSGAVHDLVDVGENSYLATIEEQFNQITKKTAADGSAYWRITDKSGTTYTYGATAASRQDAPATPQNVYKWCLDRIEDPHGNYISITYVKDRGEIYPSEISYTKNTHDSTQPTNVIQFYLEGAGIFSSKMYNTGFPVNTAKRLKTIVAKSNNQVMWAYNLEYGSYSTSWLLTTCQKFDKNANIYPVTGSITNKSSITSQPPITLEYNWFNNDMNGRYVPGPDLSVRTSSSEVTQIDLSRVKIGDFNGDGRTDIARINSLNTSEPIGIYLSNGGGFDASIPGPTVWVPDWVDGAKIDIARVLTGDFNGDGKTDIGVIEGWGNAAPISIYLSNGSGFDASIPGPTVWVSANVNDAKNDIARIITGDFNGDGKTDIAKINGAVEWTL